MNMPATYPDNHDIDDLAEEIYKSERRAAYAGQHGRPYDSYWQLSDEGRRAWQRIAETAYKHIKWSIFAESEARRLAYHAGYHEACEDADYPHDPQSAEEGALQYLERTSPKMRTAHLAP